MTYNYSASGVKELEDFFANIKLPDGPVLVNICTKIIDCHKFVENTLCLLNAHIGEKAYETYYDQIYEFAKILNNLEQLQNK